MSKSQQAHVLDHPSRATRLHLRAAISGKHWQSQFFRKRRAVVTFFAGVLLVVTAGTVATASIGGTGGHARSAASTSTPVMSGSWTTPSNETSAPIVETPGGAMSGQGDFNAIVCSSDSACIAVGGDSKLQGVAGITTDGGATWTKGSLTSASPELNAVSCWDRPNCVAVGVGSTASSNDGGATWTTHSIPTTNTTLLGVSCPSSSSCVAVGVVPGNAGPLGGQILLSTDGGTTWTSPTVPAYVGALGSVDCPSVAFCVSVGAQILVSTDGGQSWSPRYVEGGTGILRSVSCSSATSCVALGANGAGLSDSTAGGFEVATTDAGTTWNPVAMPPGSSQVNAISCVSGSCTVGGPALGAEATPLFQSDDGGKTWSSRSAPDGVTAIASLACSMTTCVFVGQEGSQAVSGSSSGGTWSAEIISGLSGALAASQ